MQVTFCAYDEPNSVGGPMVWLERLLPALRESGIESRCLFLTHHGDSGPCLEKLRANGFACEQVRCHPSSADRVRWILEQIRQQPPDVFVANLVVAAYFAGRWIRAAGIPTLGVLHSDDAFYRGIQDEFVFGAKRFRVSAVACVSAELTRQVNARNPQDVLVRHIPYGVPVSGVRGQRLPGPLRLVYVGRLVEKQKRISDVTRALCRVTSKVDGTEARLYGDGPDREAVQTILAGQHVTVPVRLMGRVEPDAMYATLQQSHVMVLLSDYEGLPIALLEAMACGVVPVCLKMRSGIPELVEDGVTGLVVDNREAAFDHAIFRLQTEPGLWERLSNAAREHIESRYGHAVSVHKWTELLHHLNGQTQPKSRKLMPAKLQLPHQHPALIAADPRPVVISRPQRLYRQGRMFAGRLRQRVSGFFGS